MPFELSNHVSILGGGKGVSLQCTEVVLEVGFSYIKSCLLSDLFSCLVNEISTILKRPEPEEALRPNLESPFPSQWPRNY